MKTTRIHYGIYSTLALIFIALSPATMHMIQHSKFIGTWSGPLHVGQVQLRLVFHISKGTEGFTALMDSPDQGAKGIPTGTVRATDDSLIVEVPVIQGILSSSISSDGDTLHGIWKQGGASFPLVLTKQDSTVSEEVQRPQTPRPPFPYQSIDVTYSNPAEGNTLAGTLTVTD